MGKYFDLLLRRKSARDQYFANLDYYLALIKKRANEILQNPKVIIFGSYIKGKMGPNSDIDVMIIAEGLENTKEDPFKKAKVRMKILEGFDPAHPFELHLVTPELFENWYKNFIKNDYLEL
ncbi:MAG: hypothetical protein KatS3mg095_0391 [Candidatus Parcubacteria bacterium]|nr:MAG: hypothetical protein KatS3mg095_0391 [Candidatus Parcubacteria bacterium]